MSHPHKQDISDVKLTIYTNLSTNVQTKLLNMDLFFIEERLRAQKIQQALRCDRVICISNGNQTNIILFYSFPVFPVKLYFQFEYYNHIQNSSKIIQKELDLRKYAITNENLKLKLKLTKMRTDKVELSCHSENPWFTNPIDMNYPLTKVGFGFNNLLYLGELYQRNGNPYDPRCTHPILFNSVIIPDKNDMKCFDVTNYSKDNRPCIKDKPLFLFSDRQDIPNYFAGNLSFINPTIGNIYKNIPQNIIFELDIRSCFQVNSIKDTTSRNLCLPSSMIIKWIAHLSKLVSQYNSLVVLPSDQMNYQCPAGKILTILANTCLTENYSISSNNSTCNESFGFEIFYNNTLRLRHMRERNECIINYILCFQNLRQRSGHVYLFPSSKPLVRPETFNPIQITNLSYLSQCNQQQNLLTLENTIFNNAPSKIPNILVRAENLYCDCEEKPFTCLITNSSSEYPIATMTFNTSDIKSNSMVYCFVGNVHSPVLNLNNMIINHICKKNTVQDLSTLYITNPFKYSISLFPLTTFSCTNTYPNRTCGIEDKGLLSLYTQYLNITSENITININYLTDGDFNKLSCSWKNSSIKHNIPTSSIITSVMETYCRNLNLPYKIDYSYYNNTHVRCKARLKNNICGIQLQKIEIGSVSCTSNTCFKNFKTERSLIKERKFSDNICIVYYRYQPQQYSIGNTIPQYTYKDNSISVPLKEKESDHSCLLENIIPEVVIERYFKHVLVTAFLDTDCTEKNLPFVVNINILKLNSVMYDNNHTIIYHKIIDSNNLQLKNNNFKPGDNNNLHFIYDHTDKTILIPISDSFIQRLVQIHQSPVIVYVKCMYNRNNEIKKIKIPIWLFKKNYKDKYYYRYLQNTDKYTWPRFKPRSPYLFKRDQTGFFVLIYLPIALCVFIPFLLIILLSILYHIRPMVREYLILRNIWA
jgi:hypothetical protein